MHISTESVRSVGSHDMKRFILLPRRSRRVATWRFSELPKHHKYVTYNRIDMIDQYVNRDKYEFAIY
jgi:hypothetical protein